MPFTISHAAAVLPFARPLARWRLLSAAVIGSMVPDFGWFMPYRPARFETHSALSLVTFCLPVGLATYWAFQRLMKTPLIELLPDGAYVRWRDIAAPADYTDPLQWALAAGGVLAGAITHLIWDGFTHEGARGVRMIPVLDDSVAIGTHHLVGARLLQDLSSLAGLLIVIGVLIYALRRGDGAPRELSRPLHAAERRAWVGAYVLAAVVLSGAFFLMKYPEETTLHGFSSPISGAAVAVLRAIGAALLAVSLCLKWRLRAYRRGGV
jgi:hypothetical protein